MSAPRTGSEAPRLAELIGALSLATDAAAGFAMETALRTCFIAVELGRAAGLPAETLRDAYYTGLLRFIGCTAFAHEQAWYAAGDDLAFSRELAPADTASARSVARRVITKIGRGAGGLARIRAVARTLTDASGPRKFATAHCDLAVRLAARLGMSAPVAAALGQIYERWDGRGNPNHLAGERIDLPARLVHVAWRAELHRGIAGPAAAVEVVRRRAGGELDPALAARFEKEARRLLAVTGQPTVWEAFLAAEPRPFVALEPARAGEIAEAFATFADVKSPFTLGHSTGVARLAQAAADLARLPDPETLRIAALLHDLGSVSVPNGIWDKPDRLNAAEWERVRMHAHESERILARSPLLAPYARLAGQHHERAGGGGYHRGVAPTEMAAHILAASDAYHAMTEERAHRAAQDPDAAAQQLAAEARAGHLDRAAVEAVLAAAGHEATRVRGGWPAGLSDREVEVLCLMARGLSNKEIGARLFISAKTVQHHVAHVYEKTGVSTRAAAALFAADKQLLK
jgi:HD-GYP domain-containing protein (c-di-GMP phosphodiesterase class II)/DNA-binding CsgD family transcriptional regulator